MSDNCQCGYVWDDVLKQCLSCSPMCEDFPETEICKNCDSVAPGCGPEGEALPTAVVVGIVMSCVAVVVVAVAALVFVYRKYWNDRDVTTRPIQVANDPGQVANDPDQEMP